MVRRGGEHVMDNFLWGLTIGIFIGATLGVTLRLMVAGKAADEAMNTGRGEDSCIGEFISAHLWGALIWAVTR
jgi:hypothetical protein